MSLSAVMFLYRKKKRFHPENCRIATFCFCFFFLTDHLVTLTTRQGITVYKIFTTLNWTTTLTVKET